MDEYSSMYFVYLITNKDHAQPIFDGWAQEAEMQTGNVIGIVRIDGGGEFE